MDRLEMQNKYKKNNPEPSMDSEEKMFITIGLSALFILPTLFLLAIIFGEDTENSCEELGGDYVIVGEEYSSALKHTIDIYGCVK